MAGATLLDQVKSRIISSPRARWCFSVALCALVALVAAIANAKGLRVLPPGSGSGSSQIAGSTTQASVELPNASALQPAADSGHLAAITTRTLLLGELTSTPPVLAEIAKQADIAPSELSGSTTFESNIPEVMARPVFEIRASQIVQQRTPYHLDIQPDPNLPRFEIYTRAPTIAGANLLADAVVPGLNAFLRADAISHHADPASQVQVEQLGPARGALLNSHATIEIAGLTFLVVFAVCAGLLLLASRVRRGWRAAEKARRAGGAPESGETLKPNASEEHRAPVGLDQRHVGRRRRAVAVYSLAPTAPPGAVAVPQGPFAPDGLRSRIGSGTWGSRSRSVSKAADDWPHTTRVLPWMIAFFLFVLWLVPFDAIQFGASLPVELKFDRILLPIIVLTWVIALAIGGRAAPRLRPSWVHAGVLAFVGLAGLTFVINAHYLNQTLELATAVKRLSQLIAFVTFFVLIASIVRRSEVRAFLRYTLVLAVIAAIGTLIEYRFQYNVFYDVAHRLLPGFQVALANSSGVDDIGRRLVRGPADLPLEAVGMFTLALPIALVGITDSKRWRTRILYGLAAALLIAASISTERKSGLLGPLAVVLTLAYFRRRELVRFAPLGLVLLLIVKLAAPGALGGVAGQLAPSQLGVSTVSERVARYDAIRPDVWAHLAFGQGFGTFYAVRILDNELLGRLVEGGVLGLVAYVLMLLSLVWVGVGAVRRRGQPGMTMGLVAAPAALGVLVLSALYDFLSYPHGPYILLSLAGLLVVAVKSPEATESPPVATESPPFGVARPPIGAEARPIRRERTAGPAWSS